VIAITAGIIVCIVHCILQVREVRRAENAQVRQDPKRSESQILAFCGEIFQQSARDMVLVGNICDRRGSGFIREAGVLSVSSV
jgi:hypothetical protein